MKTFKLWMKLSTRVEKQRLAELSGANYLYFYQLLNGTRFATAELAASIEKASIRMAKLTKGKNTLPIIKRQDLAFVCAKCPYVQRCKDKE